MILPIYSYGFPVLRKKAKEIDENYPNLKKLISDMFETSDNAYGVGLAGPQVGISIRLFVVDTTKSEKTEDPDYQLMKTFKSVFINPKIISIIGEDSSYDEGCLSFPEVFQSVIRQNEIEIEYYDEEFNFHKKKYRGFLSRVIQHEYDHIEGKLFIDKISPFKKKLIGSKLNRIQKGNISTDYKMKFPTKK